LLGYEERGKYKNLNYLLSKQRSKKQCTKTKAMLPLATTRAIDKKDVIEIERIKGAISDVKDEIK